MIDRLSSALADRYRIERELGAGGMATVYLADDLKHHRKVALKVMRPELAAVLGADRFLTEITTTANLQHPHVLPLFDSGTVEGTVFYVMPFVDGESLRNRLVREKQLPIDEAVRIATEVAGALQYAHAHGVIHRDIKPENILLHGGHALVADFGIALAAARTGDSRMTETGMSLGTPTYMSPEQAMGERALDARTDIYALGCVLYEMLVGDPPHTASTAQAIVAKVLTEKPLPIITRRDRVPQHVEDAVLTALEKLPADRFARAGDFANALAGRETSASRAIRRVAIPGTARRTPAAVLLILAVAIAGTTGWYARGVVRVPAAADVVRLTVPVLEGITVGSSEQPNIALSRDGKTLAYISDGPVRIRRLDRGDATELPGTAGASVPFFSPDGTRIGFGLNGLLHWSAVEGGAVTAITGARISYLAGASWDDQNRVVYEADAGIGGLRRIPIGGGEPEQLTTVSLAGEAYHKWPQALDGGLVLFTVLGPSGQWHDSKIILLDTRNGERTVVRERATYGRHAPSGHVLYVEANGALAALPFDIRSRKATGEPFAVESGVRVAAWGGGAMYDVANDGTLAMVRGAALNDERLWWFDRSGRRLSTVGPPTVGYQTALSPDGRTIATVTHRVGDEGISLIDVQSSREELFTLGPDAEWSPAWSPDGKRIAFSHSGPNGSRVQVQEVASGGQPTQLYTAARGRELWVDDWSRDGAWILATESGANGNDVKAIKADGSGTHVVVASSPNHEQDPRFSPNGQWIVYRGGNDLYLVSFPEPSRRFQLGPGQAPHWSRSGREILFWRSDTLFALPFVTGEERGRDVPTVLFALPKSRGSVDDYDVTADGQRFLIRFPNPDAYARGIDVVLNGFTALLAQSRGGRK